MENIKAYITDKRNKKEMQFRFFFGLQQIAEKPYYGIVVVFRFLLFAIAWRYRECIIRESNWYL